MTTEEIKQQAHKEFDEVCKTVNVAEFLDQDFDIKLKSFIDSLIDRTVLATNENWRKEIIALMRLSKTEWKAMEDLVVEISLITNKSYINNLTE